MNVTDRDTEQEDCGGSQFYFVCLRFKKILRCVSLLH